MKTINVWTVQLSKWRKLKKDDIKLLDITAKSGVSSFSPLYSNVMLYKQGLLDEEEYTELYLEKMKESIVTNSKHWDMLSMYPRVAVACYCKEGVFCHRHLFVPLMSDYLTKKGFVIKLKGEFT